MTNSEKCDWLIFEESDTVDKNSCPQIAMVNRLTLPDLVWRLYWVGAPKASYTKLIYAESLIVVVAVFRIMYLCIISLATPIEITLD